MDREGRGGVGRNAKPRMRKSRHQTPPPGQKAFINYSLFQTLGLLLTDLSQHCRSTIKIERIQNTNTEFDRLASGKNLGV